MEQALLPSTEVKATPLGIATFEDINRYAKLFAASGLFDPSDKEVKASITQEQKLAQLAVKIIAGQEYGLKPFEAMKSLHIIKGKVSPSYQLILRKIRATKGYDYKILQFDHDGASIDITRDGKSIGVSTFTKDDAVRADLAGNLWVKYRRNMMMSKAASNAANIICPEIFDGPTYTPEDFGEVVEAEDVVMSVSEPKEETKAETPKASAKRSAPKKQVAQDDGPQSLKEVQTPAVSAVSTGETTTEIPRQEVETTPGEEEWNHIVATGAELGMSEEAVDEVLTQVLEAEGIPTDSQESVMNNWTHDTVKAMLEALVIAANG